MRDRDEVTPEDDATVVVPSSAAEASDEDEATRVVARHPDPEAEHDETVVVVRDDESPGAVAPGGRPRGTSAGTGAARAATASGTAGEPVPEPAPTPVAGLTPATALSHDGRTAAAWTRPGTAGIPRVYGARAIPGQRDEAGTDLITQFVGPAPQAAHQPPVPSRPELPSIARRSRRRRLVTVIAYAAAITISIGGLWLVARVAFA